MLTRCPACATHFRVTPEQLKLRAGKVRCGECRQVFNALDRLIEELSPLAPPPLPPQPAAPQAEPARESPEAAVPPAPTAKAPVDESAAARSGLASSVAEPARESAGLVPEPAMNRGADALPAAAADTPVRVPAPAATRAPGPVETSPTTTAAADWEGILPEPAKPARHWPWVLGSTVALLALAAQAAFTYRVELAVLWPELRPALKAACQPLGCRVGLPAKVALVGIESSDLHPDGAQKGRLALSASLRNRAPFAQAFPHLELTLTDTADRPVLRKVLAPADYLPRTVAAEAGMPPRADVAVNLALDAGTVAASGYRLYIFYP